jgi:hypothetical protein
MPSPTGAGAGPDALPDAGLLEGVTDPGAEVRVRALSNRASADGPFRADAVNCGAMVFFNYHSSAGNRCISHR